MVSQIIGMINREEKRGNKLALHPNRIFERFCNESLQTGQKDLVWQQPNCVSCKS